MWDMKVVFYTAYPQYMLEAIRSAAFDFLLKPFEMKELDLIINRFVQAKIEKKGEVNIVNAMLV
jgi:two-component system LytT family response regulator